MIISPTSEKSYAFYREDAKLKSGCQVPRCVSTAPRSTNVFITPYMNYTNRADRATKTLQDSVQAAKKSSKQRKLSTEFPKASAASTAGQSKRNSYAVGAYSFDRASSSARRKSQVADKKGMEKASVVLKMSAKGAGKSESAVRSRTSKRAVGEYDEEQALARAALLKKTRQARLKEAPEDDLDLKFELKMVWKSWVLIYEIIRDLFRPY